MHEITTISRDNNSGLCEIVTAFMDDNGTPITSSGYEFSRAGTAELAGWGDHDGTAEVWEHCAGAYDLLINRDAAK